MRKPIVQIVGSASLLLLLSGACGDKKPAEPKKFEPQPVKTHTVAPTGIALDLPGNMEQLEGADENGVRFGAKGFPGEIAITVKKTDRAGGTGTGKECVGDACTYKIFSPCRRITCAPSGAFAELGSVCESVKSTAVPATVPVMSLANMGMTSGCSPEDEQAAKALDAPIDALKPQIEACVAKAGLSVPEGKQGNVKIRLESAFGAPKAPPTVSLLVEVTGFTGDTAPLAACVDALVAPLRAGLPAVKAGCGLGLDHHFQVTLEPTCAAPAAAPATPATP